MVTPPPLNRAPPPHTAGLAIASLVLGILGLSCFSFLAGIPALILGIIALNKIGKSAGLLQGQGFAIAGLVMGGISLAALPVLMAIAVPAFSQARSKAQEAACMNNVRQCCQACLTYAQAHDNTLPRTWDDVQDSLRGGTAPSPVLTCPAFRRTRQISYAIINPGKRLANLGQLKEAIIVREIAPNHQHKRVVGYADGHVQVIADQ